MRPPRRRTPAYWPAGTAGFHVNADIAYAVADHVAITGDTAFEREVGVPLLVETARLWVSLGNFDRRGRWHINGVTGPDEYSAVQNDNVFTNLMAARNLRAAADACERHPARADEHTVTAEEIRTWRRACAAVCLPYDEDLGVHQQARDFADLAEWPFEDYQERYPLLLHAPYVQLYSRQVVKQADLVLAMHWCGAAFTAEQKARNVDYYEQRTVRDSSLSACTQAVLCAEVGHLDLAHRYAREAALVDLRDLHSNSGDGVHIASLAGAWTALVAGFGGLRVQEAELRIDPALPQGITGLSFRLRWQGQRLCVSVDRDEIVLEAPEGAVRLSLGGDRVEVTPDAPVRRQLRRRAPLTPAPPQPPGRQPPPVERRGPTPGRSASRAQDVPGTEAAAPAP